MGEAAAVLHGERSDAGEGLGADHDTVSKINDIFSDGTQVEGSAQLADPSLSEIKTDAPILIMPDSGVPIDLREVRALRITNEYESIIHYDESELTTEYASFRYDPELSVIEMFESVESSASPYDETSEGYVSLEAAQDAIHRHLTGNSGAMTTIQLELTDGRKTTFAAYCREQLTQETAALDLLKHDLAKMMDSGELADAAKVAAEMSVKAAHAAALRKVVGDDAAAQTSEDVVENGVADLAAASQLTEAEEKKLARNAVEDQVFAQKVKDLFDVRMPSYEVLRLGTTPYCLRAVGAKAVPFVVTQGTLQNSASAEKHAKHHTEGHNIPQETLASMPSALRDPILILKGNGNNSFVLISDLKDRNGDHIIAAVSIDVQGQRGIVDRVDSIYGKKNLPQYLQKAIAADGILAMDIKKAEELFSHIGCQSPKSATILCFDSSITYSDKNVKRFDEVFSEDPSKTDRVDPPDDNDTGSMAPPTGAPPTPTNGGNTPPLSSNGGGAAPAETDTSSARLTSGNAEDAIHRAFSDAYETYSLSGSAREYLERAEKQMQI
ncbi:MAG: hypothetical protein IJV04_03875, partial [Lachnospiraceae bacterium]|nr:hypothetical protein [Lachnospiraceae bacterium]